jgi:molybdate transport system substrate-binding protein
VCLEEILIRGTAFIALIAGIVIISFAGCNNKDVSDLSIFAAAGTKPPMDEIGQKFRQKYHSEVNISYAGGGEVLSQMILSGSGDIFIAPEQVYMDTAESKGTVDINTIKSGAYMIPVIGVAKGNPENIRTLADYTMPGLRVALTRPETTLLGRYAPEIFQKAGIAGAVSKNIVTYAPRPDALLTMIIMGQVDAGIIWHFYRVAAGDQIDIVWIPPEQLTGIGEIKVAVTTYSLHPKAAQKFIDFMQSAEGKEIFRKYGYIVDSEELKKHWQQ